MYIFMEMWKPKESWLKLTKSEREEYLGKLAPAIQWLLESGVEIISWSLNEPATPQTTDHVYLGVYKFPSEALTVQFEQLVEQAGWYNYFEQTNLKGALDTPQAIIGHMLEI